MIDYILELDRSIFTILNGCHNNFFDGIMVFASHKFTWIPLYLCILIGLFYKKDLKKASIALIGVLITFALCDALSVALFKDVFERLRPSHEPSLEGIVRMLENKGGLYGFVSSHAANVFGLATFTLLYFKKKYYTYGIIFWASLVSYSRISVGKHYLLDIICGGIFGVLVGFGVFYLSQFISKKYLKN